MSENILIIGFTGVSAVVLLFAITLWIREMLTNRYMGVDDAMRRRIEAMEVVLEDLADRPIIPDDDKVLIPEPEQEWVNPFPDTSKGSILSVLEHIPEGLGTPRLAVLADLSEQHTGKLLKELERGGFVRQVGSSKKYHWVLND